MKKHMKNDIKTQHKPPPFYLRRKGRPRGRGADPFGDDADSVYQKGSSIEPASDEEVELTIKSWLRNW